MTFFGQLTAQEVEVCVRWTLKKIIRVTTMQNTVVVVVVVVRSTRNSTRTESREENTKSAITTVVATVATVHQSLRALLPPLLARHMTRVDAVRKTQRRATQRVSIQPIVETVDLGLCTVYKRKADLVVPVWLATQRESTLNAASVISSRAYLVMYRAFVNSCRALLLLPIILALAHRHLVCRTLFHAVLVV